jgi:hypothetical protein
MPVDLDDSDGWAEIRNVGWFQDDAKVWLPSGASFQYKACNANKSVCTGWQTEEVDCSALKPGYCNMGVDLSDPYAWVEIRNVGWFQDGDSVWMPMSASFQYKACDANKQNCTAWQTHDVDCSDLVYPLPAP